MFTEKRRMYSCAILTYNHTCTNKYLGLGTFNIQFKSLNFKTRRFIFGNWIFSSLNPWRFFANPSTHLNTQQLKYILPYIKPSTNFSFFTFSPWKKEFQTIFWWYPEPAQYKWSQRQGQSTSYHNVVILCICSACIFFSAWDKSRVKWTLCCFKLYPSSFD